MTGTRGMPLHPMIQSMLDKAAGLPPMHTVPVETIRAGDMARYSAVPRPDVAHVEDRHIDGPRGPLLVRIYRPDLIDGRPVIVFFHGSGFVICSVDTHDGFCRQMCLRAGMVVVSVDYALAPEHRFPAGPDDALAATLWVAARAAEFGGDPDRITLAGDSAGGTMAAVTALRLRDRDGPPIAAQLLIYPVTDHYSAGHPSWTERGTGFGLTADGMRWFWDLYLSDPAQADDPHASPARAADLSGLPPAHVVTAEYDLLRDEGEVFADRLSHAGVAVSRVRYPDVNHGFMNWVGLINRSDEALERASAWLRSTVGGAPAAPQTFNKVGTP
jgi:acetyl esterase